MGRKLTYDEFVRRSNEIHHEKYDYSHVVYVNGDTPVEIICPDHGQFLQRPRMHVAGQGCPECAKILRKQAAEIRLAQKRAEQAVTGVPPKPKKRRKKHVYISPYAGMSEEEKRKVVAAKRAKTCLERYGVPYAIASSDVRKKIKQTMLDRYGVENPMQNEEIRQKAETTNLEKYGCRNVMSNPEIRATAEATMLDHYGVRCALQNPELLEKAKQTNLAVYGVENPMQNPDVVQKGKETCLARYGVDNVWKSKEIQERIQQVCEQRYGVAYAAQNPEIYAKSVETKRMLGHLGTSEMEDICGSILDDVFGIDDVQHQYRDKRYPFMCDFYIKSLDLFIELNAFWTHGGHWYDAGSADDQKIVQEWSERAETSLFYKNALDNWVVRDVCKRQTAKEHKLNYVVFWQDGVHELMEWIQDGCPIRQDWQ